MTRREAKIVALKFAWQLVDRCMVAESDESFSDDEIGKIDKELDAIAQSLFNRMAKLKEPAR